MAHKKAGGSSCNGRDTAGRRLGVKNGGEAVIAGNIIAPARHQMASGRGRRHRRRPYALCAGRRQGCLPNPCQRQDLRVGCPGRSRRIDRQRTDDPAGDPLPARQPIRQAHSPKGSRHPVPLLFLPWRRTGTCGPNSRHTHGAGALARLPTFRAPASARPAPPGRSATGVRRLDPPQLAFPGPIWTCAGSSVKKKHLAKNLSAMIYFG